MQGARPCENTPEVIIYAMTTLTLELPEALSAEPDAAVQSGWFESQTEAVRAAERDSMGRPKLELLEKYLLYDIKWTLNVSKTV